MNGSGSDLSVNQREDLRRTSGGGLTGMECVGRREGGETGGARLRPRALVDPRDNAVDIDGRGSRDVLHVRFRESPIPRAAEPKRADPLGERAFDTRAARGENHRRADRDQALVDPRVR